MVHVCLWSCYVASLHVLLLASSSRIPNTYLQSIEFDKRFLRNIAEGVSALWLVKTPRAVWFVFVKLLSGNILFALWKLGHQVQFQCRRSTLNIKTIHKVSREQSLSCARSKTSFGSWTFDVWCRSKSCRTCATYQLATLYQEDDCTIRGSSEWKVTVGAEFQLLFKLVQSEELQAEKYGNMSRHRSWHLQSVQDLKLSEDRPSQRLYSSQRRSPRVCSDLASRHSGDSCKFRHENYYICTTVWVTNVFREGHHRQRATLGL